MHDVESKGARITLACVGLAASLMLLLCSMFMNFGNGQSMGRTVTSGYIYGAAAASADVLMATAPFFFFAGIRNREMTRTVAALAVWIVTTAFSAQSAIGHAAANRFDVASARAVSSTSYQDVRSEIEAARKDLGFVPQHRPADTVRADIEGLKAQRMWTASSECSEATGKAAREFCQGYHRLNAELGSAVQADKLRTRIEALVSKSDQASTANIAVTSEADPQAKVMSIMSGYDLKTTQGILVLTIVLMILMSAGLGPYVSMSMLVPPKPRRGKVVDAEIVDTVITPAPEKRLALPSPRLALGLMGATKGMAEPMAPPKPSFPARPEPGSEAKRLLEAIDFAPSFYKGPERDKDKREHVAWRFLAWAAAHGLGGEHDNEKMDSLLEEFAATDHRPAWASRVVKAELQALGKKFATTKQASVPRADGGRDRATHWVIVPPTVPKLMALLEKNKVVVPPKKAAKAPPAADKEAGYGAVIPFSDAAGDAPDALPAASEPKRAPKGLSRFMPDMEALRSLARQQKAQFQSRMLARDRKQSNRHRRSRAA